MKKTLLNVGMVCALSFIGINAQAQYEKLIVNGPTAISGIKTFTKSHDGTTSTNNWGRAIDSVWVNVPLLKAVDSLACSPLTNANFNNSWALIFRGDCEFGAKSLAAQNNGAGGVIIVNNQPGGPVGMGAGAVGAMVNIPVLMISNSDGIAINTAINQGATVTISLTPFGFGHTNDIGFVNNGASMAHAMLIPRTQLTATNGDPVDYEIINSSILGNYGSADATNVELRQTITWTPTAGSPTVVHRDTVGTATFAHLDTAIILMAQSPNSYNPKASTTGEFKIDYELAMTATDQNPGDNVNSTSLFVTDSVFCKGRYNFTKGEPVVGQGYRYNAATQLASGFLWGSLFHIPNELYIGRHVKYSISNDNQDNFTSSQTTEAFVLYWDDANFDNVLQESELTITGVGTKAYTANDSSGKVFTIDLTNEAGTGPAVMAQPGNYWVIVGGEVTQFIGVDGGSNMFPRSLAQSRRNPQVFEFYAPIHNGGQQDFFGIGGAQASMFPFVSGTNNPDSIGWNGQNGLIPAISYHISTVLGSGVETIASNFDKVSVYPNPATDNVTINLSLKKTMRNVNYKVYTMFGQMVKQVSHQDVQNDIVTIDISDLATGSYIVTVSTSENDSFAEKIVVRK